MNLTLGPILYYWPKQQVIDFYQQMSETTVDTIYLGETVCSKRRELTFSDYLSLACQLRESGKQVVLSTLTLIESPADLRTVKRYCDNGEFLVEANDIGAVGLLREKGLPFVVGAPVNCYNPQTLQQLVRLGMQRWVMPVELSQEWLSDLLNDPLILPIRDQFEVEVFALGHLPLAWSARCFTARAENRPKDECGLCCLNYPQGRFVSTQEGEKLFTLNGIQTQSGSRYNLINDLDSMHGLVDCLRLSPQQIGMHDWIGAYQKALSGQPHPGLAKGDVNGYWRRLPGIVALADQ